MARKTTAQLTSVFVDDATVSGSNFANIFESNFNLQDTGTSVASGSLNVLTNVTASAFKGDGSALTGVTGEWDGSLNGNASITGSLTVSTNITTNEIKNTDDNPYIVYDIGASSITIGDGNDISLEGPITSDSSLEIGEHLTIVGNEIQDGDGETAITLDTEGNVTIPGTLAATTLTGDRSGLTNLPASDPFPYSGSAIISSSFTAGDTNSNVLKLMGSGSVSGSGLFEIQGSSTTLFSVTDDMTDELFAANDASGLSIISAHADRTVKLGKPGGFGIVISGSNPMPNDLDANIQITGSLSVTGSALIFTGLPTSDPSVAGQVYNDGGTLKISAG